MTKSDRLTVDTFLEFYAGRFGLKIDHVSYPEDSSETPSDARIDAICAFGAFDLHLEHSSVDLIASGSMNKRSLDPAFRFLEAHLRAIPCPDGRGIIVALPLRYAEDIPALKRVAPQLADKLKDFIAHAPDDEWEKNPCLPKEVVIGDYVFGFRPDVFRTNDISLEWQSSDANYLSPEDLEKVLNGLLPQKLAKLARSVRLASRTARGVLLIETADKAARNFPAFRTPFRNFMEKSSDMCREVWGYRQGIKPTLIWESVQSHE